MRGLRDNVRPTAPSAPSAGLDRSFAGLSRSFLRVGRGPRRVLGCALGHVLVSQRVELSLRDQAPLDGEVLEGRHCPCGNTMWRDVSDERAPGPDAVVCSVPASEVAGMESRKE